MYVKRDSDDRIVAVSSEPGPGFDERIEVNNDELQSFLDQIGQEPAGTSAQIQQLRSSDMELARVVEDIISLLIDKGLIQFTELPDAAQNKLLQRKLLRSDIQRLDLLAEEDTDDLVP